MKIPQADRKHRVRAALEENRRDGGGLIPETRQCCEWLGGSRTLGLCFRRRLVQGQECGGEAGFDLSLKRRLDRQTVSQ